jgi:hypothetical protein
MQLRIFTAACACLLVAGVCPGQDGEKGIDVDFLANYYDQDGEHSPVTGGVGTEDLQVASSAFVVKWTVNPSWTLWADLGFDHITSASTDNIDTNVSSASRLDFRVFETVGVDRAFGSQSVGLSAGYSKEYDYESFHGAVRWSMDFNQKNTTLAASARHFWDTVELIDIDGMNRGTASRDTTDLSLSLTQVLYQRTVGSVEVGYTGQSGFLSTPFHEVILDPSSSKNKNKENQRVAERFPDSREKLYVGLRLNHAFTDRVVQRSYYRFYDDDFGITAHTFESETHFRLPVDIEAWIYPILRYHTQTASDFFGLPRTFSGEERYYTSDYDLRDFDSQKFGAGMRLTGWKKSRAWLLWIRSFECRLTYYTRDYGLDAVSMSYGVGWSF